MSDLINYIPIGISVISLGITGIALLLNRKDKFIEPINDLKEDVNDINIRLGVIEEKLKHNEVGQTQLSELKDLLKDIKREIK